MNQHQAQPDNITRPSRPAVESSGGKYGRPSGSCRCWAYAVVAERLLQLRAAARFEPDAPREEPAAVRTLLAGALGLAIDRVTTRRRFCHSLARLGGFLGRKSDGDPGWQIVVARSSSPPAQPARRRSRDPR
jgi:hypothetical protein